MSQPELAVPQVILPHAKRKRRAEKATSADVSSQSDLRPQDILRSRTAGGQPAQASQALLQMQRTYGNRYVQHVVSQASGFAAAKTIASQHSPTTLLRASKPKADEATALSTLYAAADILQHGRDVMAVNIQPAYQLSLDKLLAATIGVSKDNRHIEPAQRLQLLSEALQGLNPLIHILQQDPQQQIWLSGQVNRYVNDLRERLNLEAARKRVENSVVGEGGELIELPREGDTQAEKRILHSQIPKLIETLRTINEQAIRFKHHDIHHAAKDMYEEGKLPHQIHSKWGDPGLLVELMGLLTTLDGILTLTDGELAKELQNSHGFWNGAANVTEFIKAITEIIGGCIQVSFSYAGVIARFAGDAETAIKASGAARLVGTALGNIVAGIEIVHGVAVLLDSHATSEQQDEAMKDVAVGSAWFIGEYGLPALGGEAAGGIYSTAFLLTYFEVKFMAQLYGEARVGITAGWMSAAYSTMLESGKNITADMRELTKVEAILRAEKNPDQIKALTQIQREKADRLSRTIDYFLEQCEPTGYAAGAAYKPGAFKTLRRELAPLLRLKGTKSPDGLSAAGLAILQKIDWCLEHRLDLLSEETGYPLEKPEGQEAAGAE